MVSEKTYPCEPLVGEGILNVGAGICFRMASMGENVGRLSLLGKGRGEGIEVLHTERRPGWPD
jgi:hypothetical protein